MQWVLKIVSCHFVVVTAFFTSSLPRRHVNIRNGEVQRLFQDWRGQRQIDHYVIQNVIQFASSDSEEEMEFVPITRGSPEDELTAEQWKELEEGQPSEVMIMKELLGVNIFTFLLAALIILFGGLNIILGPGWLGGVIGIPGTGNIEDVSNSLPDTIDLSKPEYLLPTSSLLWLK